jgi:hypothetical protein
MQKAIVLTTLAGILAMAGWADAQTAPDFRSALAKCKVTSNDIARLACFDAVAMEIETEPPPAPSVETKSVATTTGWKASVTKDPISDGTTVMLQLLATDRSVALALRCMDRKPEVMLYWKVFLGSREVPVTIRIDDGRPDSRKWPVATDRRGAFYPANNSTFMRELTTASRLVVQVEPAAVSPITSVLDIAGLADVIGPLKDACKLPW